MSPLTHFLFKIGLPGIFLLVFVENLGVPLPTETAYIAAQALVTRGHASYFGVLLILQAAHFFGSWLSYELAVRFRKSQALHKIDDDLTDIHAKLRGWLDRYGLPAVFISRLVGYVRPWSSYVAGIIGLPRQAFLIYSFLGSLVFNLVSLSVTRTIVHFWERYPAARLGISASFAIGIIVIIATKIHSSGKKRGVTTTDTPKTS